MGVSTNNGTPKWMVYFMENPIKMDDLGGPPLFLETPIWIQNGQSNPSYPQSGPKMRYFELAQKCSEKNISNSSVFNKPHGVPLPSTSWPSGTSLRTSC